MNYNDYRCIDCYEDVIEDVTLISVENNVNQFEYKCPHCGCKFSVEKLVSFSFKRIVND